MLPVRWHNTALPNDTEARIMKGPTWPELSNAWVLAAY